MKLFIISDLHLEFYLCDPFCYEPVPDVDVMIFAGDIHNKPNHVAEFFKSLRKKTKASMIYVLGNHEYYGGRFPNSCLKYKKSLSQIKDLFILEKQTVEINDVLFVGTTLWSSYNNGLDDISAILGMHDHKKIKITNKVYAMPYIFRDEHERSVQFLKDTFENTTKDVVVISHHAPSFKSIPKRFERSTFNGAFSSDLSQLISTYQPKIWAHGHTHDRFDYNLGDTRIICNPYGYPFEDKNLSLNSCIVEI